jgi:hypothetical protein
MSPLTTITAHLFAATTMNTEEKKSQNFPKKNLEYHNQGFRKKITTERLQAHLAWKRANWVLYCETFWICNLGEMRLVEYLSRSCRKYKSMGQCFTNAAR